MASALACPIVPLSLVGAAMHFINEARFNRGLLFDLVSRPTMAARAAEALVGAA